MPGDSHALKKKRTATQKAAGPQTMALRITLYRQLPYQRSVLLRLSLSA